MELNKVYLGNNLDLIKELKDNSIDAIVTDPPYNVTANAWDNSIMNNIEIYWHEFKRVINNNAVIVMFSNQPFASELIMSNKNMFKYEWIWEKNTFGNIANTKFMPLKIHENILVFSEGAASYTKNNKGLKFYPIKTKGTPYIRDRSKKELKWGVNSSRSILREGSFLPKLSINEGERHPKSIIKFNNRSIGGLHPT